MVLYVNIIFTANTICCNLLNEFKDMTPMVTWGSMDSQGIQSWKNNECNDVVGGREKKYCPIGKSETFI